MRLSRTAKRLEAAGFLERITEPKRDRVTHIRPTSAALRWVMEAAKESVNRPALLEGVKRCHWAAGFCRQLSFRARVKESQNLLTAQRSGDTRDVGPLPLPVSMPERMRRTVRTQTGATSRRSKVG